MPFLKGRISLALTALHFEVLKLNLTKNKNIFNQINVGLFFSIITRNMLRCPIRINPFKRLSNFLGPLFKINGDDS